MKKLLLSLILLCPSSYSKPHMVAEVGNIECLTKDADPQNMIEQVGITLVGANKEERKLVARVVHTILTLTNEHQTERLLGGLTIHFKDVLGKSSFGGCLPAHQLVRNEIHMGRFCYKQDKSRFDIPKKEGILIHEMGHFVANKRGYYPKYNDAVSSWRSCKLSDYMKKNSSGKKHSNRNEEFAEVFAAYLIHGKQLKRKCKKAFNFMKDNLFLGENPSCL